MREPNGDQGKSGGERQQPGEVVARRPDCDRRVAGGRRSDHEREQSDDQCERRLEPGAAAAIGSRRDSECGKLHEPAGEMVESRGSGLGLKERVVGDVQSDDCNGAQRDRRLPGQVEAGRPQPVER